MVTKTIKGKMYELYGHYPTLADAKKSAKWLDGRLHAIPGKIIRTAITKIAKTKNTPAMYAVWLGKM